jgi:hypothetical protein
MVDTNQTDASAQAATTDSSLESSRLKSSLLVKRYRRALKAAGKSPILSIVRINYPDPFKSSPGLKDLVERVQRDLAVPEVRDAHRKQLADVDEMVIKLQAEAAEHVPAIELKSA